MAGMLLGHSWAVAFGILGNIISFMVYLAPLPTFSRVYRKKSTEGFHSVPYVVALFSAMLWIFYALLKTDASLLITINSAGCIIESVYIIMYMIYAPKAAKMLALKLISLLNIGAFGLIVALTLLLSKGAQRAQILGWICMVFSLCVFVAPLSVIRLVIRTKSVEFMPFWLSFFLTLSAVVWFIYGLLTTDIYVALPNVLGFLFGIAQMLLYIVYKNRTKALVDEKLPEHIIGPISGKLETATPPKAVYPIDGKPVVVVVLDDIELGGKELGKQEEHDQVISTDGVELEIELNNVGV